MRPAAKPISQWAAVEDIGQRTSEVHAKTCQLLCMQMSFSPLECCPAGCRLLIVLCTLLASRLLGFEVWSCHACSSCRSPADGPAGACVECVAAAHLSHFAPAARCDLPTLACTLQMSQQGPSPSGSLPLPHLTLNLLRTRARQPPQLHRALCPSGLWLTTTMRTPREPMMQGEQGHVAPLLYRGDGLLSAAHCQSRALNVGISSWWPQGASCCSLPPYGQATCPLVNQTIFFSFWEGYPRGWWGLCCCSGCSMRWAACPPGNASSQQNAQRAHAAG